MSKTRPRTPEEVSRLLSEFEQSGLSQGKYCKQLGIPVTTFDYYLRRRRLKGQRVPAAATQHLVKVKVESAQPDQQRTSGFTLVLANGRRIESNWSFAEADLARLIRIVEAV